MYTAVNLSVSMYKTLVYFSAILYVSQVVVEEVDNGMCYAVTDPHFKSFDGRYFAVFDLGQFLLFKSESRRVFEVYDMAILDTICAVFQVANFTF